MFYDNVKNRMPFQTFQKKLILPQYSAWYDYTNLANKQTLDIILGNPSIYC